MADINVVLVQEIEKFPALYNYKLVEYSRKDITERAWNVVSNKTRLSINDCKEKWRNIRSTFLRSLKPPASGSKPRKTYYLKDYLEFVLPYIKPVNESPNRGNIPAVREDDLGLFNAQEEQATITPSQDSLNFDEPSEEITEGFTLEGPVVADNSVTHGTRRRRNNSVDIAMKNYLKGKMEKNEYKKQITTNQSVMNHFFLSLLPEFDDMTNQQMRSFKIRVLQVLENIKEESQIIPSTSTSGESNYSQSTQPYSPILPVARSLSMPNPHTRNSFNETLQNVSNIDWFTQ